jgi:REP-associated tyrosine transposase
LTFNFDFIAGVDVLFTAMDRLRRYYLPGGVYFFTVVLYKRQDFLCLDWSRLLLRESIRKTRSCYGFEILAWVLLPDHLHCIWKLPEGDRDFSVRWRFIKTNYSKKAKVYVANPQPNSPSRSAKSELPIWQRRFWEHAIRDEEDLVKHFEYIHYNPVKHNLVKHPRDWPWSTYHGYLAKGFYSGSEQCPDFESFPAEDYE